MWHEHPKFFGFPRVVLPDLDVQRIFVLHTREQHGFSAAAALLPAAFGDLFVTVNAGADAYLQKMRR